MAEALGGGHEANENCPPSVPCPPPVLQPLAGPYSLAFKQKMIERLTGKEAVSAVQLARETGIRQQNLSRGLQEARSLPHVTTSRQSGPKWSVEQKA